MVGTDIVPASTELGGMLTYEPAEILKKAAYAARHAVPPICQEQMPTIILDAKLIMGSAHMHLRGKPHQSRPCI